MKSRILNKSRNKTRKNSGDRSNDRARNGRMIQNRNTTKIVNIVIKMQANAKKVGRPKEMDDREMTHQTP